MSRVDQLLDKTRETFELLAKAPDVCLSKAAMLESVGQEDYEAVRAALLATDKVEVASGRNGGLAMRRVKGNRREWGASAEKRARQFLERGKRESADGSAEALEEINQTWTQSRIAEVLGTSQPTISHWIRTGVVPPDFVEAVRKLRAELRESEATDGEKPQLPSPTAQRSAVYGDWLRGELERRHTNAVELAARSGIGINTIVALLEGRTERPQQRTRQLIERTLQASAPAEGAPVIERPPESEPWYYIGLPWTREEIDQVPDEPGVYIIHDRLGRPAYVGVAYKGAGGIRARLKKHDELRWTADRRVASSFSYALATRMPSGDPSSLARALETLLIKFMGNAILINERTVEDLMSGRSE